MYEVSFFIIKCMRCEAECNKGRVFHQLYRNVCVCQLRRE